VTPETYWLSLISLAVVLVALHSLWLGRRLRELAARERSSQHLEEKAWTQFERELAQKMARFEELVDEARRLTDSLTHKTGSPEGASPNPHSHKPNSPGESKEAPLIRDSIPSFDPRQRYRRLKSELHRQIALQLDLGRDPREVAREFGVGVGEVELVRNLIEM